jgi:hypothetical protein
MAFANVWKICKFLQTPQPYKKYANIFGAVIVKTSSIYWTSQLSLTENSQQIGNFLAIPLCLKKDERRRNEKTKVFWETFLFCFIKSYLVIATTHVDRTVGSFTYKFIFSSALFSFHNSRYCQPQARLKPKRCLGGFIFH